MANKSRSTTVPLTPKSIEAAEPGERDRELRDGLAPGLCLRITPKGVRTFFWYVQTAGKQRKVTIGHYSRAPEPGHVTLAQARNRLFELKAAHADGKLEELVAPVRRKRPAPEGALTVNALADEFMKLIVRKRRRPDEMKMILRVHIRPVIGSLPVAAITTRDCREVVERVVKKGSPTMAGNVLGALRQLLRFAQGRDDIRENPAAALDREALGVVKNVSQRVLSDEEISAFWRALDGWRALSPAVRNGLKLLLLMGVRSGELLKAEWAEIDLERREWVVPPAHMKLTMSALRTARPWRVPLGPTSVRLLEELRSLAGSIGSRFVLASFSVSEKDAAISEKALNAAMRKLFEGRPARLKFSGDRPTPHDLRKTYRSGLTQLGVPWHVAESALNHSLGAITRTYDLGDNYFTERRDAILKWDAHVADMVGLTPKVVDIAAARQAPGVP